MSNNIFKTQKTFKERLVSLKYTFLFWKGRKKGMIHTMDIRLKDIRAVFFPKDFGEKYRYLGTSVWREDNKYYNALLPIILTMDYEARPKWCPRWFLRFLHLFGSDNSIVRIRNRRLHNLEKRLTGGIMLVDWKTKWHDYDLRISVNAPKHINELTSAIEKSFYNRGFREEVLESIKKREPDFDRTSMTTSELAKYADNLIEKEND